MSKNINNSEVTQRVKTYPIIVPGMYQSKTTQQNEFGIAVLVDNNIGRTFEGLEICLKEYYERHDIPYNIRNAIMPQPRRTQFLHTANHIQYSVVLGQNESRFHPRSDGGLYDEGRFWINVTARKDKVRNAMQSAAFRDRLLEHIKTFGIQYDRVMAEQQARARNADQSITARITRSPLPREFLLPNKK